MFFFVSYALFVGLLLTNLVVGIMFSGYGRVDRLQKLSKLRRRKQGSTRRDRVSSKLSVRELNAALVEGLRDSDHYVHVRLPDQFDSSFVLSRPRSWYERWAR